MFTLLVRSILIYLLVFAIVRLMGKRQISDMQPFDLVITLLIADLASAPISDCSIPMLYGVIPILSLFILHRTVAYLALKSQRVRSLVCGHPIIVIEKGVVAEGALRAANYTLNDLMEQLRIKDVFALSQVEYAILETNGSLSVLQSGGGSDAPSEPSVLLIADGRPIPEALSAFGIGEEKLRTQLHKMGVNSPKECLYLCLEQGDTLRLQTSVRSFGRAKVRQTSLKGEGSC